MSIYLNNPWTPAMHSVIKCDELKDKIFEIGYRVQPFLNSAQVASLLEVFNNNHNWKEYKGGMFYSLYSQDLLYRKKIHEEIGAVLKPLLNDYFKDYKVIINSFVVKLSGPESEFYLHQDTTGLDENKYSPLNLWIPLVDVDEENGCLGIIEKSHHFFTPYRSISFPAPFDHIQSTVKQYLRPVRMKAGEALIFDNRVLHHSYKNLSGKTRVAVVCGLFPEEAELITCHKPEYKCGGEVELIGHDDDFLLKHPKFLIDCQERPETAKSLGFVKDPYGPIEIGEFEELCSEFGVFKSGAPPIEDTETQCNLIGEPVMPEKVKPEASMGRLNRLIERIKLML